MSFKLATRGGQGWNPDPTIDTKASEIPVVVNKEG